MSYLYGDSTPSPLQGNFIEFVRDAMDCCVHVLLASEAIRKTAGQVAAATRAAEVEVQRLESLGGVVSSAIEGVAGLGAETPAARCGAAIVRAATELVKHEAQAMRASSQSEAARMEAASGAERERCLRALEQLLLRHDLPETRLTLMLSAASGARYSARLRATAAMGLVASFDLDVPAASLYGNVVRLDRVVERLDVMAPDAGGRPQRDAKLRPHRLEKLHLVDFTVDGEEAAMKLRANADGSGGGFDVVVRSVARRVILSRFGDGGQSAGPPFELPATEAGKLIALCEKLEHPLRELTAHRKALTQVFVDGEDLRTHENPAVVVERLIASIAPVVQEVAGRSRSATELVLKRLLAGDRREEIFVAKANLLAKLEPLPPALRKLFDPLGLGEKSEPAAARPPGRVVSTQPAPRPVAASALKTVPPAPLAPSPLGAGSDIVIDAEEPSPAEPMGRVPPIRRD